MPLTIAAYTTYGPIRGCCEHRHRDNASAAACVARDYKACLKQGGYSDRQVVIVADNGVLYRRPGDENSWIPASGGRSNGAYRMVGR